MNVSGSVVSSNGSLRLSRRKMVFGLSLAAVGGLAVACAGRPAAAVPVNGQAAGAGPAALPASNAAVAPATPAPSNSASIQPPVAGAASANAVAQPTASDSVAPTATSVVGATTDTAVPPTEAAASEAAQPITSASASATSIPPTATTVPTAIPQPPKPTATAVPAPAAPQPATTNVVRMTDQFTFSPNVLTITRGSTVVWKNSGVQPHTVTCDPAKAMKKADVSLPGGAQPFDSGFVMGGQSYSHTFTVAGTYRYVCAPHEAMGMLGTIIVS